MPVIEFKVQRDAEDIYDFLEAEDGKVTSTFQFETDRCVASGDICDVYAGTFGGSSVVLKLAKNGADNDLLQNEASVLMHLYESEPAKDWDAKFLRFYPKLLHSIETEEKKAANIFPFYEKGWTLSTDIQRHYSTGLDYRDAIWMYNRLLEGLGFAHYNGVVHGAILPPHVLVSLELHGAKILDWAYAVKVRDQKDLSHIRAVVPSYHDFYPPEVFAKAPARPNMDIYMATKVLVWLMGGNVATNAMPAAVPVELQALLHKALEVDPSNRPPDAWDLHEQVETLLERLVGARRFRKLEIPSTPAS